MSIDLDRVWTTALDARHAMLSMEAEPWRNAKTIFPAVWCEHALIAVAEVLANRDLGVWRFVTAGEADFPSGHAWLELRDEREGLLYSVDITLDRFSAWQSPHVGEGPTPALLRFTVPRYDGPWQEWPGTARNDTYADYASRVVAFLEGVR